MEDVMFLDGDDYNGVSLTFQEAQKKPVIVLVMSDTCGHCVRVKPVFREFAQLYRDRVLCFKVDVDDERGREFLKKIGYNLHAVPDFLKFVKGKRILSNIKGRTIKDMIEFSQ